MNPKKILHVASRADFHLGNRCYGLPYKINNGFIRNGHNVVWFSDRDVAKNASIIPARSLGWKKCNKNFLEYCRNFKPDIIAVCSPTLIERDTLLIAREILPESIVFQYNIDGLFIDANVKKIANKASAVHWTFMTTAGPILNKIANKDAPASFIPNPIDPGIDKFQNHTKDSFKHDLLFVGGKAHWDDPEDVRVVAVDNICQDLPGLDILLSNHMWGDNYIQAYGDSKMVLCFNHRPVGVTGGIGSPLYLGSSDRISFCLGNGLLTFTNAKAELSKLYGGEALVEVDDYDDLLEKVRYYAADDDQRKKIAARGHKVAHENFNCTLVTKYMLETVLSDGYSNEYMWPTEHYFGNDS